MGGSQFKKALCSLSTLISLLMIQYESSIVVGLKARTTSPLLSRQTGQVHYPHPILSLSIRFFRGRTTLVGSLSLLLLVIVTVSIPATAHHLRRRGALGRWWPRLHVEGGLCRALRRLRSPVPRAAPHAVLDVRVPGVGVRGGALEFPGAPPGRGAAVAAQSAVRQPASVCTAVVRRRAW